MIRILPEIEYLLGAPIEVEGIKNIAIPVGIIRGMIERKTSTKKKG